MRPRADRGQHAVRAAAPQLFRRPTDRPARMEEFMSAPAAVNRAVGAFSPLSPIVRS